MSVEQNAAPSLSFVDLEAPANCEDVLQSAVEQLEGLGYVTEAGQVSEIANKIAQDMIDYRRQVVNFLVDQQAQQFVEPA
jgi:hypothetical protein